MGKKDPYHEDCLSCLKKLEEAIAKERVEEAIAKELAKKKSKA